MIRCMSHNYRTFFAVVAPCIPYFFVKILGRFIDDCIFRMAGRTGIPDDVT